MEHRTIGTGHAVRLVCAEEGVTSADIGDERIEITNIATRKHRLARSAWLQSQFVDSFLGQMPCGRDFTTEDRQQGRAVLVEFQHIIACHGFRLARTVIIQRPHTRIGAHDIGGANLLYEMAVRRRAEIVDLIRCNLCVFGGFDRHVRGADEGLVTFISDGEHDPPVGLLQHIGLVMVEQSGHDDVTALDQPHATARIGTGQRQRFGNPRAGGIDEVARFYRAPVGQVGTPDIAFAPRRHQSRLRHYFRAVPRGIDGIEDNQPRIVDPRVRIDKALARPLEGFEIGGVTLPKRARARQADPAADGVVKQQAEPHEPPRSHGMFMRQDEEHRVNKVRCGAQQTFALLERIADKFELVIFEIAQAAVDQFRRC